MVRGTYNARSVLVAPCVVAHQEVRVCDLPVANGAFLFESIHNSFESIRNSFRKCPQLVSKASTRRNPTLPPNNPAEA